MNDNENDNKFKLEDIPVLKEFEDIFPEEVPGLPTKRDNHFTVDMIHGAVLTLKSMYQMSITELKKMKPQLQ